MKVIKFWGSKSEVVSYTLFLVNSFLVAWTWRSTGRSWASSGLLALINKQNAMSLTGTYIVVQETSISITVATTCHPNSRSCPRFRGTQCLAARWSRIRRGGWRGQEALTSSRRACHRSRCRSCIAPLTTNNSLRPRSDCWYGTELRAKTPTMMRARWSHRTPPATRRGSRSRKRLGKAVGMARMPSPPSLGESRRRRQRSRRGSSRAGAASTGAS
jgi:hypothetical protein